MSSEEFIGESSILRQILASAKRLAASDAPVLIAGERGSGKELLARVIHCASPRRSQSFVRVQCAVTARELLERGLFGFDRGAFDGAISDKPGWLEMAHNGTLFFDEITRFPPDLQPKLIRALERGEFERLGGTTVIRVNVRLIGAARCLPPPRPSVNSPAHDLKTWMAEERVEPDFYNQFDGTSIQIPPLRERRQDIPLLAHHFVRMFARRMNKNIETIEPETMHALLTLDWPGNVKQLKNFIQRSVLLTQGSTLQAPLDQL